MGGCVATIALLGIMRLPAFVPATPFPHSATQGRSLTAAGSVARRAYTTMPIAEPPEDLMTIKQRPLAPTAEHLEYAIIQVSQTHSMVMEGQMIETFFMRAVPGAKVRLNRILLLKRK